MIRIIFGIFLALICGISNAEEYAAISSGGNYVRVVGAQPADDAEEEATPIGQSIIVEPTAYTLCNVILDAPSTTKAVLTGDPDAGSQTVPDIPELANDFSTAGWAIVRLPGSYFPPDDWLWNVLLYGDSCTKAVDLAAYYIGSSTVEFNLLTPVAKARILRTSIVQFDGIGKPVGITVPYGSPFAGANALWRVLHGWAGREHDLNFRAIQSGVVLPRP